MTNLNSIFTYDFNTGHLFANPDHQPTGRGARRRQGVPLGTNNGKGYLMVGVEGKNQLVHRVIWEMLNGPIPEGKVIDHINGIKDDNRIDNLRICTNVENLRNQKGGKNSVHFLPKGVTVNGKGFKAQVCFDSVVHYGGTFKTPEEAYEKACQMREEMHGEFARHA